MRIDDSSICRDCKNFEHECDFDNGCMEYCHSTSEEVKDKFTDFETPVLKCKSFELG